MKHEATLPAGEYYVGDPCYVFKESERWMKLLDEAGFFQKKAFVEFEGGVVFSSNTAYGDGHYRASDGQRYPVDAGLLGLVSKSLVDDLEYAEGCGNIIKFERPTKVSAEGGYFDFGKFTIETGEEEDEGHNFCEECGCEIDAWWGGDTCEECQEARGEDEW